MSAGYDHVDVVAVKTRNIRFGTSCVWRLSALSDLQQVTIQTTILTCVHLI